MALNTGTSKSPNKDCSLTGHGAGKSGHLRTVLSSCLLGTTVEWYDFFLYGVAAGIIFNKQFFPDDDPAVAMLLSFGTFALGFVARPLGGLFFGHIGDRVGRKKTLIMTMMTMGIATFLIGCMPTYSQVGVVAPILLIVLRLAQGVAVGGEWGGAILMSVEYAPRGKRSLFGSVPQMGLALGLVLGTGVFALMGAIMSDEAFNAWGWRVTFWLSLLLVLVGMFMRLRVVETPAFRALEEGEDRAVVPAMTLIADRDNLRHLILGMGARWVEGVSFNTWAVFSITYATGTLGMGRQGALLGVLGAALVLLVLIPVCGLLADRYSNRTMYSIGAVAAAISPFLAFPMMETRDPRIFAAALVIVLGVLYPIMYAPEGTFFAEMFPVKVRYSGISVVYQMSGIVASGLTPLILTYLLNKADGAVTFIIAYFIITGAISAVCAAFMRGSELAMERDVSQGSLTNHA